MIRIHLLRWREGIEILAQGHAEHGRAGEDIVCAGVSALLYGCLAYLEEAQSRFSGMDGTDRGAGDSTVTDSPGVPSAAPPEVESKEGNGWLWIRTRGFPDGCDTTALQVTGAGLALIAHAYPLCVALYEGRGEVRKAGTVTGISGEEEGYGESRVCRHRGDPVGQHADGTATDRTATDGTTTGG